MNPREVLDQAIANAGEVSRNDRSKWDLTYEAFAEHLDAPTGVVGKLLTQEKQLANRIVKEMSEVNPRYVVLSYVVGGETAVRLERVRETLSKAKLPAARCALIVEYDEATATVSPRELQVFHPDEVVEQLAALYPEVAPVQVMRAESAEEGMPGAATGAAAGLTKPIVLVPMVMDDRIRRAIRCSILTTSAVLLVGPPGTGKTTLLREAIEEMRANPAAFGFSDEIVEPMVVTPEESWSARDLIGGMTVAEDRTLRFREGYVLRAIRQDRWLVLDEANRADLDKIFGGLLTWLSDQEVDLGPASTRVGAPSVRLGWSSVPSSEVETVEEEGEGEEELELPVRYLAGVDWRLLGTYNALDAQRVFRFGQALGRRFLRVPVPPIEPDQFAIAAEPLLVKLPPAAREAVTGFYEAHFESEETQLGPALFMRIPDYVVIGLQAASSAAEEEGGEDAEAELIEQLLAEAYLVNVGAFLARYDEEMLAELGARVVVNGALPEAQWTWVQGLSRHLG